MHLLKVLSARKGKAEANVSLRHTVKVDTSMKAPVHHRAKIEVTFLSPLLLFEALALLFWLVSLAGVADWQRRSTKAMAVVSPHYQPPVPIDMAATPPVLRSLLRTSYEPSYEWFIVWSSFFSACNMLYVTVSRGTLWQHACAMFYSSISTAISITHCYYISQLASLTRQLVDSKDALNAVRALYAGLIGFCLANVCAIGWMCSDIDHDLALDAATKKLEVQQEVLRSGAPSRATPTPGPYLYRQVPAAAVMPVTAAPAAVPAARPPPRTASHDEVDRVLDEVLEEDSFIARGGLGRGSGTLGRGSGALGRGSGAALGRAEEGFE